jgi:nitrile hydratase subunit beta
MRPAEYLESTYYEHWLHALETLCVENGTLTRKELDERLAALSKGMH